MSAVEPTSSSRRDARLNRELLIAHARTAFVEHGAMASLEGIARSAGLAIGTLYRHFPRRIDLLVAVYGALLQRFLDDIEAGMSSADPWDRFCVFLHVLCSAQVGDRGFCDFVSQRFPDDDRTEALHNRLCGLAERVLVQGQEAGVVRPDVTTADLVMLLWASSRIAEVTGDIAPGAWRRNLDLALAGFRVADGHDFPEPPLDDEQLYRVMARLKG
ncbi:TetR/AcrR family transcriptional regulator [Nocardia flavorosea]|uniref:TetR/AcrR family transcriptional regulator n=1 Tax=Nocardia flavorosea TaxID=53429 RepID=A0A846YTZ2_9NOCA|nr:TetR/AcrR family transcriptional regulator [Nocardia flavorosea]NKY60732.1 TetR/AcrR family transcriptional regulator [Nocardia flavorosea]